MLIRSKISQPIRPWYHLMQHCSGPCQGQGIDIPQSASVTLARLCVTGSPINIVHTTCSSSLMLKGMVPVSPTGIRGSLPQMDEIGITYNT